MRFLGLFLFLLLKSQVFAQTLLENIYQMKQITDIWQLESWQIKQKDNMYIAYTIDKNNDNNFLIIFLNKKTGCRPQIALLNQFNAYTISSNIFGSIFTQNIYSQTWLDFKESNDYSFVFDNKNKYKIDYFIDIDNNGLFFLLLNNTDTLLYQIINSKELKLYNEGWIKKSIESIYDLQGAAQAMDKAMLLCF